MSSIQKFGMAILLVFLLPLVSVAQTRKTTPVKKTLHTKKSTTTTGKSPLQASVARGKIVYATNCLTCHQVDGSGVPNMNPPLDRTKWVLGSKSTLINLVLKGSHGKVEIDGETFSNTMPVQAHLTDQQIADVLTYVRNSFGNRATAVSVVEVKTARAKIK